jgi:hypothetical protein
MMNLLYKEFRLSINSFFYLFPVLIAALFFVPQWIYTLIFMYFFWITAIQIMVGYTTQNDYTFLAMIPASKKSIVRSKVYAFLIMEAIQLLFGVIFAILHNVTYGMYNFMMDANYAFFGLILVIYAAFNVIYLPMYFKTAYRFGIPVIIGTVVTLLIAGFFEYASFNIPFIYNIMESTNIVTQLSVLLVGIIIYIGASVFALKKSESNYLNIK